MRSHVESWGLGYIVAAACGLGCAAPFPLVRLTPRADDIKWVSGRAAVEQQDAGVRVAAAFEHQDGNLLSIRLEVENQTNERLDIDPAKITYAACKSAAPSSCTGAFVINPEVVLAQLDEAQSRATADATNQQALEGTLFLLSAVGDVASIANGRARPSTGTTTLVIAGNMDSNAARHDTAMQSLTAQQQVWSNVALRRNTLLPGHGTSGLVYLPVDLSAKTVWIQIRAAGHAFPFCFEEAVTPIVTSAPGPSPSM